MSMGAALKAERAVTLAARVIAVEVLCAAQALDLLAPLKTSGALQTVHAFVRSIAPTLDCGPSAIARHRGDFARIISGAFIRACDAEVK